MKALLYLQLLIPIIAFIICVVFQILICRFTKKKLLKSIVIGTFLGFIAWAVLELMLLFLGLTLQEFIFYAISNGIIYFSLVYCYFNFLNLGETARRIRVVREIYESQNGLTLNEILKAYNAAEILDKRFKRLIDKKQIVQDNNRCFINNTAILLVSKLIVLMKFMVLGKRSEFE